jgi:hypothetical protein
MILSSLHWMYQCQSVNESYLARLVVGSDKAQLLRSGTKMMMMMVASILLEDQRAEKFVMSSVDTGMLSDHAKMFVRRT